MISKERIIDIINSQKEKLRADFSVKQLGLFGSAARSELTEHSDIDILVDFEEPTFDHYMDLKFYLESLFDMKVDLVMKDNIKPRLQPIIDKEVVYAEGI